jgi:hypothetical protein
MPELRIATFAELFKHQHMIGLGRSIQNLRGSETVWKTMMEIMKVGGPVVIFH